MSTAYKPASHPFELLRVIVEHVARHFHTKITLRLEESDGNVTNLIIDELLEKKK